LIYRLFTVATAVGTPKEPISAVGTDVAFLFFLNPLFGTQLPPCWDGPQDDFLANRYGKIFDHITGKVIALVTSFIALFHNARPYATDLAVLKALIR
jgi:hypothetical protein